MTREEFVKQLAEIAPEYCAEVYDVPVQAETIIVLTPNLFLKLPRRRIFYSVDATFLDEALTGDDHESIARLLDLVLRLVELDSARDKEGR